LSLIYACIVVLGVHKIIDLIVTPSKDELLELKKMQKDYPYIVNLILVYLDHNNIELKSYMVKRVKYLIRDKYRSKEEEEIKRSLFEEAVKKGVSTTK